MRKGRGRVLLSLAVAAAVIPLFWGYHCSAYGADARHNAVGKKVAVAVEKVVTGVVEKKVAGAVGKTVDGVVGKTVTGAVEKAVAVAVEKSDKTLQLGHAAQYEYKNKKNQEDKGEDIVPSEIITLEGEGFTGKAEAHLPPETVERDGKIFYLKEKTLVNTFVEKREKEVFKMIPYHGVEFIDTIPETGRIEAVDEDTGQVVNADLPYKSHKEVGQYWDRSFSFSITVVSYDADTYRLGEATIPKYADLALYSKEFLEYLKLPEEYYQILDVSWEGDVYESNGQQRRDALATGRKLVKNMEVTYAGTVVFDGIQTQAYHSVYQQRPPEKEPDVPFVAETEAANVGELPKSVSDPKSQWRDQLQRVVITFTAITVSLGIILLVFWLIMRFMARFKRFRNRKRKS